MVDLFPTVAALAFFINPKDKIAGFKLRPCNKQPTVITVFCLSCGVCVHVIAEFGIDFVYRPICETGAIELCAAFCAPDIGTAELCQRGANDVSAFAVGRQVADNLGIVRTAEQIDAEFPAFIEDFKWQTVRSSLMEKYGLKVEQKDLQEAAEAFAAYQYAMYGMGGVPQEMIREAAQRVLADERQSRQIEENVEDQKVITAVREVVTLANKKITVEKFRELK